MMWSDDLRPVSAFKLGDVNLDGAVTVADVTTLIGNVLKGAAAEYMACADLNGDSMVTVADVTALIAKVLRGGE